MDIIFIMEPPTVTSTNKLSNVLNDIYNVFAEKCCPQYCTKDIIVCQTNINNQITYLVSMYLDIKVLDFPPEFLELVRKKGECDILIGSDSNSHSTVWNCPSTNKCGELVEDFLITNNLKCLNIGNNPTFRNTQGHTSIIYITIVNYHLATCICNWKVEYHLHLSYHFRISFSINNSSNFRDTDILNWNYKKGNWGLFKKELDIGLLKWSNAKYWSAKKRLKQN